MSTTVLGRLFQMITILAEKTSRDHKKLLKFGVHVDPGLFLPADQKLAPKWAWPGERAQFRNFGTPSICLYRMTLHSSNLVCTWILGCSCPRTTNWPPSGRGLGNVSNFEISGPPQYLSVGWSHASQIWCAHGAWAVLAHRPQIGPQLGVPWSTCQISNFWDLLNICGSDEATLFKFGAYMDPGLFLPKDDKLSRK